MKRDSQAKKAQRRNRKLELLQVETNRRRRIEHWRILGTITELLPRNADTAGQARGTLSAADVALSAGLSKKAVSRAMQHWRDWRVLWLFWKGDRVWDVRFERQIVEQLLTTWATETRKVGALLLAHKAKREAITPWPRVAKIHRK